MAGTAKGLLLLRSTLHRRRVEAKRLASTRFIKGLRQRIFFDWDVEGRAASGKENPFLFGSCLRDFEGGACGHWIYTERFVMILKKSTKWFMLIIKVDLMERGNIDEDL